VAPGLLDRHASVAGSSAGATRSLPASLWAIALGGVVVAKSGRVTPDSRGHRPRRLRDHRQPLGRGKLTAAQRPQARRNLPSASRSRLRSNGRTNRS
jgi:hypothetical protein